MRYLIFSIFFIMINLALTGCTSGSVSKQNENIVIEAGNDAIVTVPDYFGEENNNEEVHVGKTDESEGVEDYVFDSENAVEGNWLVFSDDKDLGMHSLSIMLDGNVWNYYGEADEEGVEEYKSGSWEFQMNALTLIEDDGDIFGDYFVDVISEDKLELEDLDSGDKLVWIRVKNVN